VFARNEGLIKLGVGQTRGSAPTDGEITMYKIALVPNPDGIESVFTFSDLDSLVAQPD
jgi:hypothetical protein